MAPSGTNPYSVVHKINPHDPREEVWSFIPKPIGFDLPVVIGEPCTTFVVPWIKC
jgi:hypothetical protein